MCIRDRVDATRFFYHLLIMTALLFQILGIAIENMNILLKMCIRDRLNGDQATSERARARGYIIYSILALESIYSEMCIRDR